MGRIIFITAMLVSLSAFANSEQAIDNFYNNLIEQPQSFKISSLNNDWAMESCQSQRCLRKRQVFLQAIDLWPKDLKAQVVIDLSEKWELTAFTLPQLGFILRIAEDAGLQSDALWKIEAHLISRIFSEKSQYQLELLLVSLERSSLGLSERIRNTIKYLHPKLDKKLKIQKEEVKKFPTDQMLIDLFKGSMNEANYRNGRYSSTPKLFMLCRSKREYHCLMVIRKGDGTLHRKSDGEIWTHSSLGYSRKNRPSTQSNGNTPAGIFRMEGVMPEANKQTVFGKNRRIILYFVEKSANEKSLKSLLPESSHNSQWWNTTVVARDIGRDLFRIHGTGLRSQKRRAYFPFVKTIGCVAQKENRYGGTTYNDQRILLDELMKVQGLSPKYSNESKIRGLLYVVNINDKKQNVSLDDLKAVGIQ